MIARTRIFTYLISSFGAEVAATEPGEISKNCTVVLGGEGLRIAYLNYLTFLIVAVPLGYSFALTTVDYVSTCLAFTVSHLK